MNFLSPELDKKDINAVSILGLAYIGDCVFEMMVRNSLLLGGHKAASDLHHCTVSIVNAPSQARFYEAVADLLDDEEQRVYKRGRNARVNSIPARATVAEYHSATGLEALLGYLYLSGSYDRLNELFAAGMKKSGGCGNA